MVAWAVAFILVFGTAALIPAVWSIVGLARGNTRFWPGVVGTCWAVLLLVFTLIQIGTNWGGCDSTSSTSKGAIGCAAGDTVSECKPDVWALECGRTPQGEKCPDIPDGSFCPPGEQPVFPFCEPIRPDAAVKQPAATWSDLSFIAAGLWLLWFFQYFARTGTGSWGGTTVTTTADNPMITPGWLSIAYCLIVIFMGPPSMWFHASMRDWAGWFDSMSVVFWLMFNALYVLYTLAFAMWGRGRGIARPATVLLSWVGLVGFLGILGAADSDLRLAGYFISGGLWGLAEVAYLFATLSGDVKYRRTWWLFVLNVGVLAVTMTVWVFFNDGIVSATACQGRESFPGHALFHILASISTVLTFMSFASERKVS
jgi:hypothetical protein